MLIKKVVHKIKTAALNFEFGLLQRRAKHYGYQMTANRPLQLSEIIIENYFKTKFSKHALISYVVNPFLGEIQSFHSNNRECYTIAEILNELGYNVDVIQWDNTTFLPSKKYDLVIDNHNNLERLSHYLTEDAKKIFHATNANPLYQNWVEYGRYYEMYLKKGVTVTPPRLMSPGNNSEFCDAISMFGNEFTKSTYGRYSTKVHHLPMSVSCAAEMMTERNFDTAKNKFVWLNSHGALLKGLDIAIDAFAMMPDVELYICCDLDRDSKFKDAVNNQIAKSPNIKVMGWVDIEGDIFKKIVSESAWVLGTSFSEGGGGSTLNGMAKGLIPVVSKTSSLTLSPNTGFYLRENNAAELRTLIRKIIKLSNEDLKEMSYNSYRFVASNHTIDNFKKKYKEFVIEITKEKSPLKIKANNTYDFRADKKNITENRLYSYKD